MLAHAPMLLILLLRRQQQQQRRQQQELLQQKQRQTKQRLKQPQLHKGLAHQFRRHLTQESSIGGSSSNSNGRIHAGLGQEETFYEDAWVCLQLQTGQLDLETVSSR